MAPTGSRYPHHRSSSLKQSMWVLAWVFLWFMVLVAASASAEDEIDLPQLLEQIDQRYQNSGFSAYFVQQSTLTAMDITDLASGKLYVQRPGKMHWAYKEPEPQAIISDGETLWIHRPLDNQVTIGKTPTLFGGGRGASFLSDIKSLQEGFQIALQPPHSPSHWHLKLIPKKTTTDLDHVLIQVQKADHIITRITTVNAYGDRTDIELISVRMDAQLKPELFTFDIPEGTDVVRLDQ